LAYSNFISILSDTDKGSSDPKPKEVINPEVKEVVILLKLKRWRQGASVDVYKVYKASALAIRSPKAKRTRGDKKGKDPVEIDG